MENIYSLWFLVINRSGSCVRFGVIRIRRGSRRVGNRGDVITGCCRGRVRIINGRGLGLLVIIWFNVIPAREAKEDQLIL